MACGVDEAGRGPVIGPMVVAGVCASREVLENLGVRDSKKLSPKRREFLAGEIKKIADSIAIRVVEPEEIDEMRERMTINEMEVRIFAEIISKLGGEVIYLDAADVNEERFADKIIANLSYSPRIISKHKADDIYPEVSAASIIAKVERDKIIRRIAEEIGDFGSGYPADERTKEFLKSYYEKHGELPPHVRRSWKSAKRLLRSEKQRSLDSF